MNKSGALGQVDNGFTAGQIQVESPYPIQEISSLTIIQKLNEHAQLHLEGIQWDSKGVDWIERVTSRDPIAIYGEKQEGRILLFSGTVTDVEVIEGNQLHLIRLQAASYSSFLDYQERCHSFQDYGMSYHGLIQNVLHAYPGSTFLSPAISAEQTTGQVFIQYRETDWAFLKRIASQFHTVLIPDVSGTVPRFSVGLTKKLTELYDGCHVAMERDIGQYQAALSKGLEVYEEQYIKYHLDSRQRLELGNQVIYQDQLLVVESSRAFLQKGLLCFSYILGFEAGTAVPVQTNPWLRGVSLLGSVLEAKNQQVKLKLRIDQGQAGTTACWFPFASQGGNLFYCMPEEGTELSLYFSSDRETSAIAVNVVRKNGGSCSKTSKPSMKYMATPQGKEWKLGETDISFTAQEELFLAMDAGQGVRIKSHEDLNIFSKQKLILAAREQVKAFAETGDIIVNANEVSSLYLMGGAAGNTHIRAGADLMYKGRYKEVFSQRLNEEIAWEEKTFDWWELGKNVLIGLAAVAVVCVAAAAIVGTGGLAGPIIMGAALSGGLAVVGTAVGDVMRGEVSSTGDYLLAGLKGVVEGAVSGAILGLPVLKGVTLLGNKLFAKMVISGTTALFTDAISQGIDVFSGRSKGYNWEQGLFSFGVGFAMPAVARGMNVGAKKLAARYGTKMPGWMQKALCTLGGEPIDLIEGNVLYDTVDFELPGPLPLVFRRNWCSASRLVGHLGHGTRFNFEMGMEVLEEDRALSVFLNDGRVGIFQSLLTGEETFSYENGLLLRRMENFYELVEPESGYRYQLVACEGGYLPYKLNRVSNRAGHAIEFSYDANGYLSQIRDSAGRILKAAVNEAGRLTEIALQEAGGHTRTLVRYVYSEDQDLTAVTDAMGKVLHMKYSNHLLRQKTDRNNHSFYWKYDKEEDGARAVESWGDGGVLTILIQYHEEEGYNEVWTSRDGKPARYDYDKRSLCTRITYPDFSETGKSYNERYQVVQTVDEEGRATAFEYNDWSQVTGITFADGSKTKFAYNQEGALTSRVNPEGHSRSFHWKEDGTLGSTLDEEGRVTVYRYNEQKLVEAIVNAKREEVSFCYDQHFNLSRITLPDGSSSQFEYDSRGNCISEKNPLGAMETYQYDSLNRMVRAYLSDGNQIALTYDGYDGVLKAKDNNREVSFTYTILGSITSRTQGERTIRYDYNSEEQLVSVTNEKGEIWQFDRDEKGNITREIQYGGQTYAYERDYSGLITKICRPGGRYTRYQYDKIGQVVRTDYHDHSFDAFAYNKNGDLAEAENQHVKLRLERDKTGQIIREWQDYDWAAKEYDESGSCTRITSRFGADIRMERNEMGQVIELAAFRNKKRQWAAQMDYNSLGQETRRLVSGNVCSQFEYDQIGRPIYHTVGMQPAGGERGFRRNRYEWGINGQLKRVTNELTGGSVLYSYDLFGHLAGSKANQFEELFRTTDEVGNLYERKDRSDRIYGAGSQLEQSGISRKEPRNHHQPGRQEEKKAPAGTRFFYDEEGNLVKKTEASGEQWFYAYYGNGMLKKVVKPDRSGVYFQYDPFGRRIEKAVSIEGSEHSYSKAEAGVPPEEDAWEKAGDGWLKRPGRAKQDSYTDKMENQSLYAEESREQKNCQYTNVIRFLWSGNTLLHEWEVGEEGKRKLRERAGEKADYLLKIEEKADQKARAEAVKGSEPPNGLITWVFQDDFIPRAKLTENDAYSIISDYLGTPVEAYDEEGKKVWERELDIYGRVKVRLEDRYGRTTDLVGEDGFIPFRYQGQYEDMETGLYYNRFRYYSPSDGCYTQLDPIGLEGNNPTLYGYVSNPNIYIDPFGLDQFGPNQDVYALFNKSDVINGLPKPGARPFYVGISQNSNVRLGQHTNSGRYNPATDVKVDLHKNVDYAMGRAYEQTYIEKYKTIKTTNPKANQQNSFRHNRTDTRGKAFEAEYQKINNKQSNSSNMKGSC
ncbi:DUF6531 domain-containing protein [Anaerocolumna jejuensis]|uniref:DUF6531 domain-containing protein n=1 Tax=Anaerocolumna jejuensis TaxID=259063 RepID=UPI003F7B80BD